MAEHKEKKHATVKFYTQIIVALSIITVLEIIVPQVVAHNDNNALAIAALVILAVLKYVLVVAFFMHLYYDQPLCTFLFVTGMILGGGTMAGLLSAMPHNTYFPGAEKTEETGPKLPAAIANNPKAMAGMKTFEANCITCHTLAVVPTATGVIGPDLDGIFERGATRVKGMDARQYIDMSIKDPGAYVVEGFPNSMTNFGFNDATRAELVEFLMLASDPKVTAAPAAAPSGDVSPTPEPGSGVSPAPGTVQESQASPNAGGSPGSGGPQPPDASDSPAATATP